MNELASPWTVATTRVSHFCCFNSGFRTSVKALTVVLFLWHMLFLPYFQMSAIYSIVTKHF